MKNTIKDEKMNKLVEKYVTWGYAGRLALGTLGLILIISHEKADAIERYEAKMKTPVTQTVKAPVTTPTQTVQPKAQASQAVSEYEREMEQVVTRCEQMKNYIIKTSKQKESLARANKIVKTSQQMQYEGCSVTSQEIAEKIGGAILLQQIGPAFGIK